MQINKIIGNVVFKRGTTFVLKEEQRKYSLSTIF